MKIVIIGYGKMGHMIEQIALERGHEIVGVIDPTLAVSHQPSVISFDSEEFRSADVAIEFTTPATAKDNILRAWAQGVPVVCGSTGWKPEELTKDKGQWTIDGNKVVIKDETGKTMLVWSSNYSIGVNITFDLNKMLAEIMTKQPQYTPSIKEIHHIHKLDAPSGTAKTLAEGLRVTGEGLWNDVPIESIREGEVPGTHIVTWDSPEDTIVLTHIAKGRRGFALGAVLAAEEIKN
jgi:4-hydroxy-tetrahydrodipicolinate reductase